MYPQLVRYNLRICTSLGPWIIVIPVAATMLVLFALMAMASLLREATPVLVLELLGSLLMAFVGVSLLRPEYQYDCLETVLTRPVSFRAILTVRMFLAGLAVLMLEALLCVYMRVVMDKPFSPGLALVSAAVSMAFLAAVATAVAAAWRSPTLGFVTAAFYWVVDAAVGPELNPLVTLRGYASYIANSEGIYAYWWVGKLLLVGLTILFAIVTALLTARPLAQRRFRLYFRTIATLVAIAFLYIASGAFYKVEWGRRHEAELLNRSRLWYQQAFKVYGPIPVAYLLGLDFPRFLGYRPPWHKPQPDPEGRLPAERYDSLQQLKVVAWGSSEGPWGDNGLYELGRMSISVAEDDASGESLALGIKCLEQLVEEHPESPFAPAALERLVHIYDQTGRPADADAAMDRLLTLYPTSVATLEAGEAQLASLTAQKRWTDAVILAERLVKIASSDERPLFLEQLGNLLANVAVARYVEAGQVLMQAGIEARQRAQEATSVDQPDPDSINRMRELAALSERVRVKIAELKQAGKL
ncbi:MAG: tetratricopeptide repeat protein [Candidatus Zipacnadales bacterium]